MVRPSKALWFHVATLVCTRLLFWVLVLVIPLGQAPRLQAQPSPEPTKEQLLLAKVRSASSSKEKVDLLNELSQLLAYENAQKASDYANQAVKLAQPSKYLEGWAAALGNQATTLAYMGRHEETAQLCRQAIELAQQSKILSSLTKAYQDAGICAREQNDIQGALDYYRKAQELVQKHRIEDPTTLSALYGNIAVAYAMLEQHDKAIEYYKKVLPLVQEGERFSLIAIFNIAYSFNELGDFKNSQEYASKLLELAHKGKNQMFIAHASGLLGEACFKEFEASHAPHLLAQARSHYARAMELLGSFDKNINYTSTLIAFAKVLIAQGRHLEALPHLQSALALAQNAKFTLDEAKAHHLLAIIHRANGNAALALTHLERASELDQRVYKDNLKEKVSQLMVRLDTANRKAELETARLRNESLQKDAALHRHIIALVTSISVLLLVTAILLAVLYQKKKQTADLLRTLSRTDTLTGLLNRRAMAEALQREMVRIARSGENLSVILSDIDHFKRFNDHYGHQCGDAVLKQVANALQGVLRKNDQIARWGGEEFLILLPGNGAKEGALVAEKLRACVERESLHWDDMELSITMSFGVAACGPGKEIDHCILLADQALYSAKERGRNQVAMAEPIPEKTGVPGS